MEDEQLPEISNFQASISLIDENKPLKFCNARPVPVHRKDLINIELDALEKQGVITPICASNHGSPVVLVAKKNNRYRMCVYFKSTLNGNIKSDAYPLPTIEEVFAKIGNSCIFVKVDLKSAYWQIGLDEKAKNVSVINTSKGLYRLNRLQMVPSFKNAWSK